MAWLAKSDFMMPVELDTLWFGNSPEDTKPYVHWVTTTAILIIWAASPFRAVDQPPTLFAWPGTVDPATGEVTLSIREDVITVADLDPNEVITRVEALDGGGYVVYTDNAGGS